MVDKCAWKYREQVRETLLIAQAMNYNYQDCQVAESRLLPVVFLLNDSPTPSF